MIRTIAGVSSVILLSVALWAQTPDPQPAFEVATIKPGNPGGGPMRVALLYQPGGKLNAENVSLRMLITQAYDVRDFQISGGPGWINSDRWNIQAKPETAVELGEPGKASEEQIKSFQERMRLMTQRLLADRFQLKVHHESKELPIYALVVDKRGLKLTESKDVPGPMIRFTGRGQVSGQKVTMSQIAKFLSDRVGRSVNDETGLKGNYDFKLEWTPDENQPAGPLGAQPGAPQPPPPDANGPSIFTAVQEQLGLKLESKKGPVDILVIDHVEKPSEN